MWNRKPPSKEYAAIIRNKNICVNHFLDRAHTLPYIQIDAFSPTLSPDLADFNVKSRKPVGKKKRKINISKSKARRDYEYGRKRKMLIHSDD